MKEFLLLSNDEKIRLKRLNDDKATITALKKLVLNSLNNPPASMEVSYLAAQRIAINILYEIFHELSVTKTDDKSEKENINLI